MATKEEIRAASDYYVAVTEEQTITEPSAPPGTKRTTKREHISPTEYGEKFEETIAYMHGPDSPAWGAIKSVTEGDVVPV